MSTMKHRKQFVCQLLVWRVSVILSQNCTISPYVDECGNAGLLWNCSGSGFNRLPTAFPPELKNQNVALDLSYNRFSSVTEDTFDQIASYSNVTSVILHHNDITEIGNLAFHDLSNLCSLDLSSSNLEKDKIDTDAFSAISKLTILRIDQNNFHYQGYPDISMSKLHSLQVLKIDVFRNFSFTKLFEELKSLSKLEFNCIGSFSLTNSSFYGLRLSPIYSIDMSFFGHVNRDVTEDLFCSFPYITDDVILNFGGKCNLSIVLRSLKCLQHREINNISITHTRDVSRSELIIFDDWSTEYLINICVSNLTLHHNGIYGIKRNIYNTKLWNCLEYFDLSFNRIIFLDSTWLISFLTFPRIREFNQCCNDRRGELMYNPYNASQQKYPSITITLPNTLEVLDLSENYFNNAIKKGPFVTLKAKNLLKFYLQNTNAPLVSWIFAFPSLETFDLSENSFENINSKIFQGVRNIRQLYAVNVRLNFQKNLISKGLFKNLKYLTKLDISKNSLTFLPRSVFKDQKKSLKEIYLDNNMLSVLPNSLMDLEGLCILSARFNLISKFSENDQNLLSAMKNVSIYLEGNPISCACFNIQSLKWMKDHKHMFPDRFNVLCIESKNPIVELFEDQTWRKFELDCQSKEWLTFSAVLLVLTMLTFAIIVAIKKYRVHLEYVILRLKNKWKGIPLRKPDNNFLYDVYVSYSDLDYLWVTKTLYPILESLNVKPCLDEDIYGGRTILEGIVNRINECRKVLFVVSESFLDIGQSSIEVRTAITHAVHNQFQGYIVVLIKDGFPLERLPDELKNIWWCIEYFGWSEEEQNEVILKKLTDIFKPE
nr:toll-like receptor 3 [Crassostrea gigas]